MFERQIKKRLVNYFFKGEVIILVGARQVGKTSLIKTIAKEQKIKKDLLFLNCDLLDDREILNQGKITTLKRIVGRNKYIFIDVDKDDENNIKSEKLIFPRFHQLEVVSELLEDVKENKSGETYLVQHSAGSGKTYSITWLTHRLSDLHDKDDKVIFDSVIVVSDRLSLD
ncbi:MAG: AAA family ATPase, partial [Minisyncoccales bacterium]